jgi:hypothetical protein
MPTDLSADTTTVEDRTNDLAATIACYRTAGKYDPDTRDWVKMHLPTLVTYPELDITPACLEAARYWGSMPDVDRVGEELDCLLGLFDSAFHPSIRFAALVGVLDGRTSEHPLAKKAFRLWVATQTPQDQFEDVLDMLHDE